MLESHGLGSLTATTTAAGATSTRTSTTLTLSALTTGTASAAALSTRQQTLDEFNNATAPGAVSFPSAEKLPDSSGCSVE